MSENGTAEKAQAAHEAAMIALYGECRRRTRLAGRPMYHDWHLGGQPARGTDSIVIARVCCYCAPEGITILVRSAMSEPQIEAERLRHGPRLVLERVVPKSPILRPDQG